MFPLELLLVVLELAYFDEDYRPDRATLAACCLVCRSWKDFAQGLLFRSIRVTENPTSLQLVESLGSNPVLGSCIRILHVSLDTDAVDPSTLPRILSVMPRLYELSIEATGIIELSSTITDELRLLSNSLTLRSLVLVRTGVQSRILYQLLELWPSVRFLQLHSEMAGTPPKARPAFRLYELILVRIPTNENIEWLLLDNENALRFLELRDDPSTALEWSLGDQAKHIRCLRIARYNVRSAGLVSHCTNLEELVLWSAPTLFQTRDIPSTIRRFGLRGLLHHLYRDARQQAFSMIATWPNLDTVVCHPGDVAELQPVMSARNVKINFEPTLLPFYKVCDCLSTAIPS